MPKTSENDDLGGYAPVAARLQLFFAQYPEGQVITKLISRNDGEITFRASIYRSPLDTRPSAKGWAAEVVGDGEINEVACLENTETSAVGRALANLGFLASRYRPSLEEMAKAARGRARVAENNADYRSGSTATVAETEKRSADLQRQADIAADAMSVANELEKLGVSLSDLEPMRTELRSIDTSEAAIRRIERALRHKLRTLRESLVSRPSITF